MNRFRRKTAEIPSQSTFLTQFRGESTVKRNASLTGSPILAQYARAKIGLLSIGLSKARSFLPEGSLS